MTARKHKKSKRKRGAPLNWKEDYLNSSAEGTDKRSYLVLGQGPGKRYTVKVKTKFGGVTIGDRYQYRTNAKKAAEAFDALDEDETFKAVWPGRT